MSKIEKRKRLGHAGQMERKKARAIHKLKVAVHEVVHPVALLEAKNAPGTSQSETIHWYLEGKRVEAGGQGRDRSEQG